MSRINFTEEQLFDIEARFLSGETLRSIGKIYGVQHGVISNRLQELGYSTARRVKLSDDKIADKWLELDGDTYKTSLHFKISPEIVNASLRRKNMFKDKRLTTSGYRSRAFPKNKRISNHGYVRWFDPESPWSNPSGDVFEHRKVYGEYLGRPFYPGENVHHKNGNRADNRLENLELWVTLQPAGQRPEDLVEYAKEILRRYG